MKVLIINTHPEDSIGGSEVQCDLIATYLTRFKHEVLYFAVKGKQEEYNRKYKVLKKHLDIFTLFHTLYIFRPDIVYWRYNKKHFLSSALITKMFKSRMIFTISHVRDTKWFVWGHSSTFKDFIRVIQNKKDIRAKILQILFSIRPLFSNFINHFGFYFVDGLISINEQYINILPVKKQTVIKNSMQIEKIHFSWKRPYVVWIANIKERKNPEKYLELVEKLQELPVDFLMIGKIQNTKYIEIIEQFQKHHSNFHYLGPKTIEEVNGILEKSLFLVHTCDPEGFPNNFIQAWLSGKPTVSLYYDPDNLIRYHTIGFLSETMNQFVTDVQKLIHSKKLRNDMGEKARIFAESNFSSERNVRKIEEFLRSFV